VYSRCLVAVQYPAQAALPSLVRHNITWHEESKPDSFVTLVNDIITAIYLPLPPVAHVLLLLVWRMAATVY
jgi:hypothetical protein